MSGVDLMRIRLGASLRGAPSPLAAADRLCVACVDLLGVDGASISVVVGGASRGTFGSSGEMSRRLDELQFTFGEGPCMDAVRSGRLVSAPDLGDVSEQRWPAFGAAMLDAGILAVFALPVSVGGGRVGALDLFRHTRGSLTEDTMTGAALAAELAGVPLTNLMDADVDWDAAAQGGDGWDQLASLERVEVYQATGMVMAALDVDAEEALVRLRGYAFAEGLTASDVAWQVVERRLLPHPEGWRTGDGTGGTEETGR